jgi:hypothetical protein
MGELDKAGGSGRRAGPRRAACNTGKGVEIGSADAIGLADPGGGEPSVANMAAHGFRVEVEACGGFFHCKKAL